MNHRHSRTAPQRRFLAAAAIALGLPFAALAMPPAGDDFAPPSGHHARHDGPRGMAPHLLRGLKLDAAQQDKLFALMHERAPAERERRKVADKARAELDRLAAAEPFDAAAAHAAADAHGKALAALALGRAETEAAIRALLTPEQRRDFDQRRSRAPGGPDDHRGHGGGHCGGDRDGGRPAAARR